MTTMETKTSAKSKACWLRVLSFVQDKYTNLRESLVLHIWSNGCTGQSRSRFLFSFLFQFIMDHTLFWYYGERHHGKVPMDFLVEPSRMVFFEMLDPKKQNIRHVEHFTFYANSILKGITSLYMPLEKV